ncbi:twin-arginine translocase subunit TatC [Brevibacillus humidisoli]|uniref:twin-arginine translocase subunit TatC n=1 Tax=Brevibacillus humidisoli TaxID=2895522 RepID=UPI001E453A19|nr:twin-arginine translocase subunit TatC [Brevibacillus humidisoli]UFJ40610.1 twin-arginine translocase subunit TatC [Brevibacillus humidisoli]
MDQRKMNVIEHLGDLRKRLIIVIGFFFVSLIICFLFVDHIYHFLANRSEEKLAILGPTDILSIYLKLAGIGAVAFTIPVAAYQMWRFVEPALTERERRVTLMYVPALFLLFVAGLSFSYFVLFPMTYQFVLGLSNGNFDLVITANDYFRFMINLSLPFGFLFELPVVVLFLSHLGLLNPHRLAKLRKPAYFLLCVISITITPPDFVSDVLVIVPLLALYEISISLSRLIHGKRLKQQAETALSGESMV